MSDIPEGKAPAFQFYPDSWLSSADISLMTPAEEGAYIRLLCHAWLQDDCGIPDDDAALAVLSRLGPNGWKKSSGKLRSKFDALNGRLVNQRLRKERVKQEEHRAKQSDSGKRGAEKRWRRDGKPMATPLGLPLKPCGVPINSPMAKNGSSSPIPDNNPLIPQNDLPDLGGGELLDWYENLFTGVWMPDTWKLIPRYISTPEALEQFHRNTPLWMRTKKYRDGFGFDSLKFISSRIWQKPPHESLMDHQEQRDSGRVKSIPMPIPARSRSAS